MILDIGFLLVLVLWSSAVGRRLLDRLDPGPKHPCDALALAVPLGLGMLSLAALALGEVGWLHRRGLVSLVLSSWLVARLVLRRAVPPPNVAATDATSCAER